MAQKNCLECGKLFEYAPNPNFPDKRKYCDSCSASKKAQWDAKQSGQAIPAVVKPIAAQSVGVKKETGEFQSTSWVHSVAASSYEFGKAGNRFKLYFEDVADLQAKIDALMQLRVPPELIGLE